MVKKSNGVNIPMDLTIGTGQADFDGLDFYYGSKSLEGASEIVALTAATVINCDLTHQVPSIEGIRNMFKKSFVSSYGQRFELQIFGTEQVRVLKYLGEDGFFQLFSHYLGLSVGLHVPITKPVAKSWHRTYVRDDVDLIERIQGPLRRLHKPIENQGYNIALNRRRTRLIDFNRNTFDYITHEVVEKERFVLEASITRFNRLTGTGRLVVDDESSSVSFSPATAWKYFPHKQRKHLSHNLDANTGDEVFLPLKLEVSRVLGVNDIIKHYRLYRVVL